MLLIRGQIEEDFVEKLLNHHFWMPRVVEGQGCG